MDNVNHPDHYNQGGVECIDAIEAALTPEEFRGFLKGNAMKYLWRENGKGGDEDLGKARWYAERLCNEFPGTEPGNVRKLGKVVDVRSDGKGVIAAAKLEAEWEEFLGALVPIHCTKPTVEGAYPYLLEKLARACNHMEQKLGNCEKCCFYDGGSCAVEDEFDVAREMGFDAEFEYCLAGRGERIVTAGNMR